MTGPTSGSAAQVPAPPAADPFLPPAPATVRSRPRPPWSVVVASLALALLCLATAVAALLLDRPVASDAGGTDAGTEAIRGSALDAARERTTALTTYDHRTLDRDFAAVLETATGPFEDEYRATTAELRTTFVQAQASADAEVVAAGLESLQLPPEGPERAVAVVAVDQVITTAGAAPRTERNRLRMELIRRDGTWLVERVERL